MNYKNQISDRVKILLIDEDESIFYLIRRVLQRENYRLYTSTSGRSGMEMSTSICPDLILMDTQLSDMDGIGLIQWFREWTDCPILVVSGQTGYMDKVNALYAGANDYMEKPFHLQELEARIRSLTRRKFVQKDICLECGGIRFDTIKREVYAKGNKVSLTRKENGILEYLLFNIGRPVSQEELIEHVWDASVDSFSGSIRVHMSSLRRKLKAELGYDPIINKVGEGYKLREESD